MRKRQTKDNRTHPFVRYGCVSLSFHFFFIWFVVVVAVAAAAFFSCVTIKMPKSSGVACTLCVCVCVFRIGEETTFTLKCQNLIYTNSFQGYCCRSNSFSYIFLGSLCVCVCFFILAESFCNAHFIRQSKLFWILFRHKPQATFFQCLCCCFSLSQSPLHPSHGIYSSNCFTLSHFSHSIHGAHVFAFVLDRTRNRWFLNWALVLKHPNNEQTNVWKKCEYFPNSILC